MILPLRYLFLKTFVFNGNPLNFNGDIINFLKIKNIYFFNEVTIKI